MIKLTKRMSTDLKAHVPTFPKTLQPLRKRGAFMCYTAMTQTGWHKARKQINSGGINHSCCKGPQISTLT